MKFGTCNEYFQDWPLEQVFDYAAAIGYDGVEIAPFTIAPSVEEIGTGRRREIRDAAAASGVEIIGLHWLLLSPEGLYINHPDEAIRGRTHDYVRSLIHFCGALGGQVMVIGSPKQRNVQEGWNFDDCWKRARDSFAGCAELAAERDVVINFEPLAPSETNFVNTHTEAIKFTKQFDHPNFKIILDTKAMCSMGQPIPEIIRESKGEFAYYHANDENLKGPGFGEVDFVPIGEALREVGLSLIHI